MFNCYYLFTEKSPVDGPFEDENPAQVKSSLQISNWIVKQKWQRQKNLDRSTNCELENGSKYSLSRQIRKEQRRRKEENVHFDGDGQTEEDTAQRPEVGDEAVDGNVEQGGGHGVVEKSEHKDGMNPVRGQAHEDQHIRRDFLCSDHDSKTQKVSDWEVKNPLKKFT